MNPVIDYYRNWPIPVADDFDLYWRIVNAKDLDWEDEYQWWGDSCVKRSHKGQHFTQTDYARALVCLANCNAGDPDFMQYITNLALHQQLAGPINQLASV